MCGVTCTDSDALIEHCKTDPNHKALELKFTDETFDFLFQEDMGMRAETH